MSYLSQVDADVWRGSRPEPNDFASIRAKFRTIVSLEGLEEDKKEADELVPACVISQPIVFSEIYITGISQLKLETITTQLVSSDLAKPILVHCQHGEDRTGLVVAAYRVKYNDISVEDAWKEALKFGYRNWLNFGLNRTWNEFVNQYRSKE